MSDIASSLPARHLRFVDTAAEAFRRRLAAIVESAGLPAEEAEALGERAGMAAAASAIWVDRVGPFLDTDGVITLLDGVTKQAVSQRVRGRRLLALRTGSGRLVYPLWQFREGETLPGLAPVLAAAGYDPDRPTTGWTIAAWLAEKDELLAAAPRDLLAAGRIEPVVEAAADLATALGADERAAAGAEAA